MSRLLKERQGKVARLILNRPERHNAFDEALIEELTQAIDEAESDPSVRVLVLAANGKSFSAGADLDWMRRMAT
jgi:methylglutaconyl-CoA hydratase